jgi:putative membrane protein
MTPLLAFWGWHWFFLWPLIPLFWIFLWFLVIRFFFWRGGPRRRGACGPRQYSHDPQTILARRYANGEIDHNEYRERLGHLTT